MQVSSEVSALEMKKNAAEDAKRRREALQIQRQKIAAAAAAVEPTLQSTVSISGTGVSGVPGFTSPTLGLKAQAAVDSARVVVRRVLANKVFLFLYGSQAQALPCCFSSSFGAYTI